MEKLITLILIIQTLTIQSQDKYYIDYNKYCNKIVFEDLNRLKAQINAFCLEYNLLTIELSTVLNCGKADTGYFKYSQDTLFLCTEQIPEINITDSDTTYLVNVVECDCLFNISFDIYGFSKIPKSIYFNGEPIVLENNKYKKRESTERNGLSEILYDDCGYSYRLNYNKNQKIEKIFRIQGDKHQILIFDENQKLIEIKTAKYSNDNVNSVKIR